MRYPPQFLDELRARLPVSEVVGRRVRLKKAGREWKGLSPFNQERTPSFTVNDQKGFFHDFSSGKHGDIFRFVMESEGVPFPEAVERLAAMAGVPMPTVSREAEAREERRRTLYDVLELAAKFFEGALAGRAGSQARDYLTQRGVAEGLRRQFRFGYAPGERFALKEHLGAAGIPVPDLIEAGLLIGGDDIPVPFDRFRDRIMFPITDSRGRVIAFGGRALAKDVPAKYLNSPETPLFHKGATLYNAAAARTAAHEGAPVIVVEGYLDVVAMVQAGYPAAVAPLGTALTDDQIQLLWRMADEPVLCFDGDKAGRRAANRAIDIALPLLRPGKSLRFAALPEGQDPDDLVRSGGREAIAEVLAAGQGLIDVLWAREVSAINLDTPERRAALETRLNEALSAIGDEMVRRHYRQEVERRLRQLFSGPSAPQRAGKAQARRPMGADRGPSRWDRTRGRPAQTTTLATGAMLGANSLLRGFRSAMPPREALILYAVLNHPWLLETHAEEFAEVEFLYPDADRLRRAILDRMDGQTSFDPQSLRLELGRAGLDRIVARVDAAITHSSDWPARPDAGAEDVGRWWGHVISLHHKARTLHKELRDAETALGTEPSEQNLSWLRDVRERLWALEGTEAQIEGFGAASGRSVSSV